MNPRGAPRVGIAIASPGIVTRREMRQLLSDVEIVFEEYSVQRADVDSNQAVVTGEVQRAAAALGTRDPDVLVFIGVAPSVALGSARDHELRDVFESRTDRPVIMAIEATFAAFAHLGVGDAVVIAPLAGGMEDRIPRYFADHGIHVPAVLTLGLPTAQVIHGTTEAATVELAKRAIAAAPDASCLYAFGGGLPSLGVLASLEKTLRKPVFSSNTATARAVRKELGLGALGFPAGALFP